ncbi:MAG: TatD family hydrolase [Chloroflexi bacterium]|nr:TatD family hydrolase [Actinomycetota bacterium]MCL5108418.1 TatD family hydrolase [Chloroflexota bacterium]
MQPESVPLAPPTLVDSHAHLEDPAFAGEDAVLVERALAAGVGQIVTVGTDLATSRRAVATAARHPAVFAAVGIHPHEAGQLDAGALDELRRLARQPKVVAIGEIGLDFYRDLSPRPVQRAAFAAQLALAGELDLPVVVHDREAHAEIVAALREFAAGHPGARGVLHCFSGDEGMAREAIELGFYISFAGPLTYANAGRLQRLAAALPLERLLVETDCPYLTPVPLRGKRNVPASADWHWRGDNEPANAALVAEKLAHLRGLGLAEVAAATTANAARLFSLP